MGSFKNFPPKVEWGEPGRAEYVVEMAKQGILAEPDYEKKPKKKKQAKSKKKDRVSGRR